MSEPVDPSAPAAPEPPPESRLELVDTVPRRPWWKKALLFFTFCGLAAALAGGAVGFGLYWHFSQGLPEIPRVDEYRPALLSEFRSDDGDLVGEFYKERRKVVPYQQIPKKLVQAFIAAEDKNFFDHFGLDLKGTARAAFMILRGHHVQGGSTLTQQTAKSILVSAAFQQIDEDALSAQAESKVPPAPPPEKSALLAQIDQLRRERLGNAYEGAGTAAIPPSKDELARATQLLQAHANDLRDRQVQVAFTHLLEGARRKAFAEATVRKGKLGIIRKIREAILALRLEKALTKEEILYLYLNNVFLGHHAYGVQSAAENYFRKNVGELSLAEMATLAGLPQSPSANPYASAKKAKERRSYVLGRMLADGMIAQADYTAAMGAPVKAFGVEDVFHEVAPFFAEQVRRDIVARYTNERLLTQGLTVDLTMDAERQRGAQDAMLAGLIEVDKRQGYYGPLLHLGSEAEKRAFETRIEKELKPGEPVHDGYYPAVVSKVSDKDQLVELVIGKSHKGKLPLAGMRWARKPNPEAYYPSALINAPSSALKQGDVVLVRQRSLEEMKAEADSYTQSHIPTDAPLYDLEQEPQLEGAIVSIDPQKNYVPAMIGGYDFAASEFNRAFQACRQPGSAFKPIEYSAAIEQLKYTASTVIVDSPIVFDDPDTQLRWKPANYENDFKGDVTVRAALMESMNIPAIKVFNAVGIQNVRAWAKQLGLTTEVHADLSSALGSSCVHPWELAQVYAVFDRNGKREPVYFIRQVRDRFGRVLEDHTAYDDPWASSADRIHAAYAKLFETPIQATTPETAFLTTWLLHDVATGGTGAMASRLGKPVAGKTGTTNDSHDTWFVGYTHDLLTAVWVGYDDYKHDPMGRYEAGSRASLPIWLDYMKHALEGIPQPWFSPPPGTDLVAMKIDPETGKKARPGQRNAALEYFRRGDEPKADDASGAVVPLNPMMTP